MQLQLVSRNFITELWNYIRKYVWYESQNLHSTVLQFIEQGLETAGSVPGINKFLKPGNCDCWNLYLEHRSGSHKLLKVTVLLNGIERRTEPHIIR